MFCVESLLSIWVIQVKYENCVNIVALKEVYYLLHFGLMLTLIMVLHFSTASVHVLPRKWQSGRDEERDCKKNRDGCTLITSLRS